MKTLFLILLIIFIYVIMYFGAVMLTLAVVSLLNALFAFGIPINGSILLWSFFVMIAGIVLALIFEK